MPSPSKRHRSHPFGGPQRVAPFIATVAIITIPLVCLPFLSYSAATSNTSTVVFASILFRHGDRTPTDFYPTDPYQDEIYWPEGVGQLTRVGIKKGYALGEWIRKRYGALLREEYKIDDLYVVSSDYDRCLMTAQMLLAGLYLPLSSEPVPLSWQSIPVHTTPIQLDQLIVMRKPCPRYNRELDKFRNLTNTTEEDRRLFDYLTGHVGKNISDILGVEFLYNTLEIEENRGLSLPNWTETVYPEPMRTIAAKSLAAFTGNDILKRLRAGPIVKDIINHMTDKSLNKLQPDRKMFLYSGHDITLTSLLRALGTDELYKPDPNAAVIVELHRYLPDEKYFVEVHYLNNPTEENSSLIKTACPDPCALSEFVAALSDVVPVNWDEECQEDARNNNAY